MANEFKIGDNVQFEDDGGKLIKGAIVRLDHLFGQLHYFVVDTVYGEFHVYCEDLTKVDEVVCDEVVYDEGYFEILDALIKEHVADEVTSAMQLPKAV